MRRTCQAFALVLCLAACAGPSGTAGPSVYQYAAFDAFARGEYAGTLPLSALKAHGDFGLGTFDGLDGEMIVLDGVVYRADGDLRLSRPASTLTSPFAEVVFFRPDAGQSLDQPLDMAALGRWLDSRLPEGAFAAARVTARFKSLTIRSENGLARPYPPLEEALKSQHVVELSDVSGTLVGLRGPATKNGAWVPGWHFHFVSADGRTGGHVLGGEIQSGRADWMATRLFSLELAPAGRP